MSLEHKARQRLARELERHDALKAAQVVDIVWQVLGIKELAYERMFTPPYYEATEARNAATYDAFVSETKRRMAEDVARAIIERGPVEFSTERAVSEHPDAQNIAARTLVITRLA